MVPARVRALCEAGWDHSCPWQRGSCGTGRFPGLLQAELPCPVLSPEPCVPEQLGAVGDGHRAGQLELLRTWQLSDLPCKPCPENHRLVPCSCCPSSFLKLRYVQE